MAKERIFTAYGKECTPLEDFDWSLYEDGYNGVSMRINQHVKAQHGDKVYCHESYAQELYEKYLKGASGKSVTPKDSTEGKVYTVGDINMVSDHEISVDSDNGMTSVIDMNKEMQFVKSLGLESVKDFMHYLGNSPEFKRELLNADLVAKVVDSNRVSIWEGYRAKIESGFMEDLTRKGGPKYGYSAKILELNNGGYTVDIMGVRCFLPSSLAASGPITDFESLIGKTVQVCVVNFSNVTKNFVVSHKKYLEITLPARVAEELAIGKEVSVKVTGQSKNGLFCAIQDKTGEFSFASLMHRSTMSPDMEASFDKKEFVLGDMFHAFIHKISWDDKGGCRIVIGDKAPALRSEQEKEEISK